MDALPIDYAVSALVTLVVVVEPVGLAPIFLGITHGLPSATRRRVGLRAALIAAVILAGTAAFGNWLLSQLGISLPAFRIAGGLLLFSIASEMVFGVRFERQSRTAERALEEDVTNIAAFPIAIPAAGGARRDDSDRQAGARPIYVATLLAAIAIVIGLCIAVFEVASRVGSVLGTTANIVLSRILGVVLAALSRAIRDRRYARGLSPLMRPMGRPIPTKPIRAKTQSRCYCALPFPPFAPRSPASAELA
jgi:multiple antibiotic resistance protein